MIATVYAGLGDADRAFEWIDRAILGRDDQLVLLKVDTHLDSLRATGASGCHAPRRDSLSAQAPE